MKYDLWIAALGIVAAPTAVSSQHLRKSFANGHEEPLPPPLVDIPSLPNDGSIETTWGDVFPHLKDTWNDRTSSMFYADDKVSDIELFEGDFSTSNATTSIIPVRNEDSRVLNEDKYPRPDPLMSLPCNEGVAFDCLATPLSSLPIPLDGPLVIPCGTCVHVDISDGSQLDLPNGLRIEGKLYFPPEANLKIYTPMVMVLGILKMDYPLVGNQVTISLHNVKDANGNEVLVDGKPIDHFFYADPSQQDPRTGRCLPDAAKKCKVGKKVIAVVGGQLDIQGYDPTCPSWESLLDYSTTSTAEPSASPSVSMEPTVNPESPCAGNLIINGDFEDPDDFMAGWRERGFEAKTKVYNDPLLPGNTAAQVYKRRGHNIYGMVQRLSNDNHRCFIYGQTWKFEFDVRVLNRSTGEGIDCNPAADECPHVRFKGKDIPSGNTQWLHTSSNNNYENNQWNKDEWNHFEFVFDTHPGWLDLDYMQAEIMGGDGNADLVVDNVRWQRYYPNKQPSYREVGQDLKCPTEDLDGRLFKSTDTPTLEGCLQLCADTEGCNYFSFKESSGYCSGCSLENDSFVVSGSKYVAYELTTSSSPVAAPVSIIDIDDGMEGGTNNQIHLSQAAASCWQPGSEVVITSSSNSWNNHQTAVIESTDPFAGTLKLTSGIDPVSTVASDPKHAVEVALLNRRIVFEAEDDANDDLHGGHLIVFATPEVVQRIEGIEIRNFGQQGILGRYPIHFHICESAAGSVVRNNVVRQANQRCYVMHGTNDVLIEDNVAFDTRGHCYMTEDGTEYGNEFLRNLGAYTHDAEKNRLLDDQSGREENDDNSATFWMTNMENKFEGNVAAGSESNGYWAETHDSLTMGRANGSMYQRPDHSPMFTGFGEYGSFKDNTAHSFGSTGFTQYPPGWLPPEPTVIENFRAFRGRRHAFLLHNVKNLVFKGGYSAQIEGLAFCIFGADNTLVDGLEMVGRIEGDKELCYNNHWTAISIYPHRAPTNQRFSPLENWGATFQNMHLSQWTPKETGCDNNALIDVETTLIAQAGWDAYNSFHNVTHDGTTPLIATACRYENIGGTDAAIEFTGDSSSLYGEYGGTGFLIGSLHLPFADSGQGCHDVEGCLYFCPGTCLRTVVFRTSSGTDVENYTMKVSDGKGNLVVVDKFYNNKDMHKIGDTWERQLTYSVSLPEGNFDVWWEDDNGKMVYPKFVHPYWEKRPTCSSYATEDSINILKPPADERCEELIHNGGFNIGADGLDGWQHFRSDHESSASAGVNGQNAVVFDRDYGHFVQWLDTSCLEEGEYTFRVYYKVLDDDGNDITEDGLRPGPMLGFYETQVDDHQKWKRFETLKLEAPSRDTTPSKEFNVVGNNGWIARSQSLNVCEGDCDRNEDCLPGLKCWQSNSVPTPGCIGTPRSTSEYCYDPWTKEASGFYLLTNSFYIGADTAAKAEGFRVFFSNIREGLRFANMSLQKAPWSTNTPTAEPTDAVAATSPPTATPSVSPTKTPTATPTASPTASPSAPPTNPPTAKPTALPTPSPSATPSAKPTQFPTASPTLDPSLVEQALVVMNYVVKTMQPAFESSITLPLLGSDLEARFNEFVTEVESYAAENFPGGVSNLNTYDKDLPDNVPSLDDYTSNILNALEQQYVDANTVALSELVQGIKDDWNMKIEAAIEVAVKVAVAIKTDDIANELPSQSFPLDAATLEALQTELTTAAIDYGDKVINCAEVEVNSMLV